MPATARPTPKPTVVGALTAGVWAAQWAVVSADALLREGATTGAFYRIVAGWLASLLGAVICLGLGRVLQRTAWRSLAPNIGVVLLLGSVLAVIWTALVGLLILPLTRGAFELAGVSVLATGSARPSATSVWWLFVSWGAVWLSITYADDLRVSEARAEEAQNRVLELEGLVEALQAPTPASGELWAPTRRGAVRLSAQDVVSFSAERDYVRLRAADGEQYLIRATLQGLLARLNLPAFLRVHRSCAVNLRHVARMEAFGARGLALHLADGQRVVVGRSYVSAARRAIAASAPPPA